MNFKTLNTADYPPEDYIKYIAIITEEQAMELAGQVYTDTSLFYPVILDGNWIIGLGEIAYCDNPKFMWVKDLEVFYYVPYP
jgi:hypothetical protein